MSVKSVRGAIQISENSISAIDDGVVRIISRLIEVNKIENSSIINIIFSQTKDLTSKNPAASLRKIGFSDIPLFCTQEPEVDGGMERVIRILLTLETDRILKPVYLDGARLLRRDITDNEK